MKPKSLILISMVLAATTAYGKVELPQFITDSMVVQQRSTLTIPGKAKKGATVKITPSWDNQTVKVKADKKGNFKARLATPGAGGPYTITFDDGQKTVLNDIWSGEVWFCSGQSNMEMPVEGWGRVMDYRKEVAEADYPLLRLLQVKKQTSYSPQQDTEVNMGGWRPATPETVANFSAIGYFFGRQLDTELGIPIGIIDCTWGGTPIEAWMSYDELKANDEFPQQLQAIEDCGFDASVSLATYNQRLAAWQERMIPADPGFDVGELQSGWATMNVPGLWEETVLPDFDGTVWMQRVVNVSEADAAEPAKLMLSQIDDNDQAYVNGVKVGETDSYSMNREYTVPAGTLRAGDNVISVRVIDTGGGGGFWGDADDICLVTASGKQKLTGAWQYKVESDFVTDPMPASPVDPTFPTVLYNAMMHPITVLPVKGVLWYQGCANVGRDKQYSKLFKAMINQWRQEWNDEELPFYFVQLAGFLAPNRFQPHSAWAALRQAQKDALELPKVGMAVAIDLGNPDDIHPKNKQEVARRLADMALNNQYRRLRAWRAPDIEKVEVDGRYVRIAFDGDVTMHGGGQGFLVQDASGKWAQGYGRQLSSTVIEVSSDEVAEPVEVRYDWADYPEGNLRGCTGLPVSPFAVQTAKK